MFDKLLIANRGEIACRIARTARRLGVRTVAVCSDSDREALHVRSADEAFVLGGASPAESYLHVGRVIDAALRSGAQAVHPGYGFLSESASFASACVDAGLCFVGPPAAAIEAMGLKDAAKLRMERAGVPVLPGGSLASLERSQWAAVADGIGYPVLVKAVAGGGGKGMRRVDGPAELDAAIDSAQREAEAAFGDGSVLIEKLLEHPRHVEVQVFADRHGNAVHLFERDCSMQRRHQKVVEEAPAPGLPESLREAMGEAAVTAARAIGYEGAGTCEFLLDSAGGMETASFFFMEMNTRLQVEHPVTEAVCGVDLVEWQLRVAAGEALPREQVDLSLRGHAVEVRLYAEDPFRDYLPQTGRIEPVRWPNGEGVRVDAGVAAGDEVSVHYDPLLAKIIAHAPTRARALARLEGALEQLDVGGVRTNHAQLAAIVAHPEFRAGVLDTDFLQRHREQLLADAPDDVARAAALGCVGMLSFRARGAPNASPWNATDSFRVNLPKSEWLRVRLDGQLLELRVSTSAAGYLVQCGEATLEVCAPRLVGHVLEAFVGGQRVRVGVSPAVGGIEVRAGGRLRRLRVEQVDDAVDAAPGGGASVRAPMPGQVLQVRVQAGQAVEQGEPLVLLTAMKMEHTLVAEAPAQVAKVHAKVGAQVAEGDVLVELWPPSSTGEDHDAG